MRESIVSRALDGFVIKRSLDIDRELAGLASGTMRTERMLEVSESVMAVARGAQWSRAASYHGRALHALGRIADGYAIWEEAWQQADRLDDPNACGLASRMGAGCSLMLYDYPRAEHWCTRELGRQRSLLVPNWRYVLNNLLASALVSQGNLPAARECLSEFEGATKQHWLLAYHEGDWARSMMLFQQEFDRARAAGQLLIMTDAGSVIGRLARVANRRIDAEAILDDSLDAALACPDLNRELFIRIEQAIISLDFGQIARAEKELRRCKEILDNGEDWCGHLGAYLHTSALSKVAKEVLSNHGSGERWHLAIGRGAEPVSAEVAAEFRAAIDIFRRCHAPWEETATLLYWAQSLFATRQIREAMQTFESAFAIFDRIGNRQWSEQIQNAIFGFYASSDLFAPVTIGDGDGANVFRKEGDYWTVSFLGTMFRLRDTIGMHYICRLLGNPGIEFAAQNLIDAVQKAPSKRNAGKARLAKRNGRMAEPSHSHNAENAERERARLMVTKRIKDVVARIRQSHPELGRHLATQIRTGYSCRYDADATHPESWMT